MQDAVHPAGTLEPRDLGRLPRGYDFSTKIPIEPLPFGCWAVKASGVEQARLPTSANDVTLHSRGLVLNVNDPVLGAPVLVGYDTGTPATLLRRGYAWVPVEAPVLEFGAVYARFAVGAGGSQLGALRGDSDGGTAALVTRAQFISDGRRCALLSLNL